MSISYKAIDPDTIDTLRPFPAIASRVLAACNSDASTSRDVSKIISTDAGYAHRLLQVANSSTFGFKGSITTVERAIVVLGFRQVKRLALSLAGADLFSHGKDAQQARAALWEHSLACGTIAQQLATCQSTLDPGEVFLAGIFHDVGKLVFYDTAPDEYQRLSESEGTLPTVAVEVDAFGMDHTNIGVRCSDNWSLPKSIREAVESHHEFTDESAPAIGALIACANRLSLEWQIGPPIAVLEENDLEATLGICGIDSSDVEEIREPSKIDFDEMLQLCSP